MAPLALLPAKPARRRGCQCKGYLSKDRKLPWEHKARFNFLKTLKRLMIRKRNAHLAEKEGMETEVTVTFHLWFTCAASLPVHLGPAETQCRGVSRASHLPHALGQWPSREPGGATYRRLGAAPSVSMASIPTGWGLAPEVAAHPPSFPSCGHTRRLQGLRAAPPARAGCPSAEGTPRRPRICPPLVPSHLPHGPRPRNRSPE